MVESMDIFIRRLPESVTRLDLIHFISGALKPHWALFSAPPKTANVDCEIMRVTDIDSQTVEYHGIAHFAQPNEAMGVIARLNGTLLKGKQMEVRKFFHRSSLRDRRIHSSSNPLPTHVFEQRHEDRRRSQLLIEEFHAGATRIQGYSPQLHA